MTVFYSALYARQLQAYIKSYIQVYAFLDRIPDRMENNVPSRSQKIKNRVRQYSYIQTQVAGLFMNII